MIELHIGNELAHYGVYAERRMEMNVYENVAHGFVCVMIGKNGKGDVVYSRNLHSVINAAYKVMLGEHYALCNSRCAGRIYKHFKLVFVAFQAVVSGLVQLCAFRQKTLVRNYSVCVLVYIKADKRLDIGQRGFVFDKPIHILLAEKYRFAFAVCEKVKLFLSRKLTVYRNEYSGRLKHCKIGYYPVVTVFADDRYMRRAESHCGKRSAERLDCLIKFDIRHLADGAVGIFEFVREFFSVFIYSHPEHFADGRKRFYGFKFFFLFCHNG